MYFIYLLECNNGSIYTGITTDVGRRFQEHKDGKGGHYTRARGAIKILYTEKYITRSEALKREAQIKRMPRAAKRMLIKGKRLSGI